MTNKPAVYNYNIDKVHEFGGKVQQQIKVATKGNYLTEMNAGELNSNFMEPLMKLKNEVTRLPKINKERKFFGLTIGKGIVNRIEDSKTRLSSVQVLLDNVEDEANAHLDNLLTNIEDSNTFLNNSTNFINEVEGYISQINEKIKETEKDGNPDKIAKDYYLQLLNSRRDELVSSLILVQQQQQQVSNLRGASLVSSQKLRSTINIGIPLLSSQLVQNIMTMKLENSNKTVDALTTSLNELSAANTQNWSAAMIRTAEQQTQGIVTVEVMQQNRQLIQDTAKRIIEIQTTTDVNRQTQLEAEMRVSLDTFHGRNDDAIHTNIDHVNSIGNNKLDSL